MDDLYPDDDDEAETSTSVMQKNTYTVDGKTIATLKQLIAYLPEGASLIYNREHGFGWQTTQGWETFWK